MLLDSVSTLRSARHTEQRASHVVSKRVWCALCASILTVTALYTYLLFGPQNCPGFQTCIHSLTTLVPASYSWCMLGMLIKYLTIHSVYECVYVHLCVYMCVCECVYVHVHVLVHTHYVCAWNTVEPPITDPPRGGQPPHNGQSPWHGLKSLPL